MKRLYVWENVLTDWTSGVMFALAESEDAARKAVRKAGDNLSSVIADSEAKPKVFNRTVGFAVWGGG